MEEYVPEKNVNKRSRDELDSDSSESKRVHSLDWNRVELEIELNPNSAESDPVDRVSSPEFDEVGGAGVGELDSQIREDILDILDEPDREEEIQDLDSVIKSFEEEILHPRDVSPQQTFIDLTLSDSGGDLGYLLEASDDELGLPPTVTSENDVKSEPKSGSAIGFENHELVRYDSFDLGMIAGIMDGDSERDFLTVGGLFDYPEPSDISRRTESLPAL